MDWKEFDKQVDLEGLKEDVENNTGGNYEKVPHGQYEVAITKMELGVTKETNKPMVKVQFKIVSDGEYEGKLIFMNQVVEQGFQIHLVNDFLRSLETDIEIDFESYSQYEQLLMDVLEAVNGNFEYGLKYSKNEKNEKFDVFEITDVFELEK